MVLKLFSKFRGAIQTDGYERYDLLDAKKGIILLGCWAHARRKFLKRERMICNAPTMPSHKYSCSMMWNARLMTSI